MAQPRASSLSGNPHEYFRSRRREIHFAPNGRLTRLTRSEAEAEVKKRGGKTTSTVSGKTTCVVAGEKAGSKLVKANKLGIRVIDEDDFLKMIES